ncbi:MAG: FAD-binding protein, partial [Spirochaetaceae bacterium]|nr:FAD-binding protein [Spirochaetaceae bacterium]
MIDIFCDSEITRYAMRNELLSRHTTFKVGGPADWYIKPPCEGFASAAAAIILFANKNNIPFFVLGGGANVVFSDAGFRGIVFDTTDYVQVSAAENKILFSSGIKSNDAAWEAQKLGLSGMEFLAGLPGTIGGAVRMNAR